MYNFAQILFWDWRNKKQIACLEDSHIDDVTQVCAIQIASIICGNDLCLNLKLDLMALIENFNPVV